ncbi:zinc metallopeptidase RseP [Saccharobesus litoralis]|uniref:Zinc metalloprotease n=1 Tax=Saccharobesus litoralis TaxID=2172099 RepID=A0A2S0VVC4_9ALTE|nr:sigma E protease regulator RseP [Saccharobesus litoralis]AWB68145.1 zinc metallopeptidase RseP [Saccharobesus litoralis]
MTFIWNLLFFIILIGVLVTVHEYGHFIVARKCGVKVLRFAIGFGSPLFKWHDKQGTEYVIAAIPLGGYVKMLDSRIEDVPQAYHDQTFNYKPVSQRIAIVAAGPIFNFILAIVAFWAMYLIGVQSPKPIIGDIVKDSIVAQANIQSSSEIFSINGQRTNTWQDVQLELSRVIGAPDVIVEVIAKHQQQPKSRVLDLTYWTPKPESESLITSIGIKPYRPNIHAIVSQVADKSPAFNVLQIGDKIIAVNGNKIADWRDFQTQVWPYPNEEIAIQVERNGRELELFLKLGVTKHRDGKTVGFVGVSPTVEPFPPEYTNHQQYNVLAAIPVAVEKTWNTITLSFAMVAKLLSGEVSIKALSGPVTIAEGAGTTASYGLVHFLSFMAFISVNLGIINLLPLPVLDGGHLLYYLIELATGKPVPESVQELGYKIGLILIFSMMSIAIFNDIARL